MKKVVVSFISGFLLAIGFSVAYAEVESYVGKKVDSEAPLIVDGKRSEVPAIIIRGRSFIPLRAAGELLGVKVAWTGGEVIVDKERSESPTSPEEAARAEQEQLSQETAIKNEISSQISKLRGDIDLLKMQIRTQENEISNREDGLKLMPEYISPGVKYEGSDLQKQHQEDLERLKRELADLKVRLAELEQQKAELEAELAN